MMNGKATCVIVGMVMTLYCQPSLLQAGTTNQSMQQVFNAPAKRLLLTGFDLLSPPDGSEISDSPNKFDWDPSIDPEGGAVTYTFVVSEDENFETIAYVEDGIPSSAFVLYFDGLFRDGFSYYWKVEAVDSRGNRMESNQTWMFVKNFTNFVNGVLIGYVDDCDTTTALSGVDCYADGGMSAISDQGIFLMTGPAGCYTGTCRIAGYFSQTFSFCLNAGNEVDVDVCLRQDVADNCSCVLKEVMGPTQELDVFRRFRDETLQATVKGRRYILWYYLFSPELKQIILADRSLRSELVRLAEASIPMLRSIAAGEETVVSAGDRADMIQFLIRVQNTSSSALEAVLDTVINDVEQGRLLPK